MLVPNGSIPVSKHDALVYLYSPFNRQPANFDRLIPSFKNAPDIAQIWEASANPSILNTVLYASHVSAGYPSPADDYVESAFDLNEQLINNPSSTFFVKVSGDSMTNAGINQNDILIVDKAILPKDKHIIIAVVDGELTVKRLSIKNGEIYLCPENDNYSPIHITQDTQFGIWGVVSKVIHSFI